MLRKKGYSFINLAGLTLGLACCLVIFQYVALEYSFDRFHGHGDDLYRILQSYARGDEDLGAGGAFTGFALAPLLDAEVPEIEQVTRVHPEWSGAIVSRTGEPGEVFEEQAVYYVDPSFLDMFSFPLVAGTASLSPGTLVLTESAARRYFGDENPVGRSLAWTGIAGLTYTITGIIEDVPANSHLQFEFLLPMEDLLRSDNYVDEPEGGWSWNNFATYVQLNPSAEPEIVERKMTQVYLAHRGDELEDLGFRGALGVQPLHDIHLNADVDGEPLGALLGSYRTVYFFSIIALITLLIALVNYVNLATARALDRSREVGVRKVVGAERRQLVVQFMSESAVTIGFATVLAIGLTVFLAPLVNTLTGIRLSAALWLSPVFWIALIATLGVATLLAGLYPAFVLSSFQPVSVLKGTAGSVGGRFLLRRSLVVLQFTASIVLIGGTGVVYDQLSYMRQIDLGLELEQIAAVTGPRVLSDGTDPVSAQATFVQELHRIPGVRDVATSSSLPGQGFNWNGAGFRRSEDVPSNRHNGVVTYVDSSFAELYGLELVAGQEFGGITISDEEGALGPVMANETAVRTLGYASPAEAVGKTIYIGDYETYILGVYKDFNWMSAHEERQNIFFGFTPAGLHVSVQVGTANVSATMAAVEDAYERLFPGNVFEFEFVEEAFNRQYTSEERFAALFSAFAVLAVIIACLGLFGLASFTARQRTKEIGVRKVLGASIPGLVSMLAQDFVKLVLIAIAVALPAAYILMQRWLEQFAYRVDVDPVLFGAVAVTTLLVALATVSYQSVRAALANPVASLRSE